MTRITLAEDIRPGDTIVYPYEHPPVRVVVLRDAIKEPDHFGRPLMRFWCRREDTGAEGYMSYGPGGIAHVATRPFSERGGVMETVLVKAASHRARAKLLALVGRDNAEALFSMHRSTGKGVYRIPASLATEAKSIVGVSGYRDGDDLMRCWGL